MTIAYLVEERLVFIIRGDILCYMCLCMCKRGKESLFASSTRGKIVNRYQLQYFIDARAERYCK